MKKFILPIALVATVFTSCKTTTDKLPETSKQLLLTPDTTNLYRADASSDVAKGNDIASGTTSYAPVQSRRQTRYYAPSPKPAPVAVPDPVATTPPVVTPATPNVVTGTSAVGTAPAETTTASAPAPVEAKKKGISDAAKGAAIGGVGGAVAGAVIGKSGKGAVIGGVIGAAGGYILGRQKDKKSGRTDYADN